MSQERIELDGLQLADMFSINSENEKEGGFPRSGRIFQSGKRGKNATRAWSCSATKGRDYDLAPHIDGEYFDE